MGAAQFDREAFVASKESPSPGPFSVPVAVVAAIIIFMFAGFVLYEFGFAKRRASGGAGQALELNQLKEKLSALDHRLDQMEKKHKSVPAATLAARPEQEPDKSAELPRSRTLTRTVYRIAPPSASLLRSSAAGLPQAGAQLALEDKHISSLRSEVAASREEWEATADRLGTVVGELGSQRDEIDSLNQSIDRSQRQDYAFLLEKKSGPQHVGPLTLWLESTDTRTGHYTMRVLVNDKWIEFKNRALHEAVEFYTDGQAHPVELVVSGISRGQVMGNVGVR
jgi:hypothetical protein